MKTILLTLILIAPAVLAGDWVIDGNQKPGRNGTPMYPERSCIGAVINGKCHGSILHPGPVPKRCHGTVLQGKCIGAEI